MPKTKPAQITFALPKETKKQLEKRANDNYRSLSQEMRRLAHKSLED